MPEDCKCDDHRSNMEPHKKCWRIKCLKVEYKKKSQEINVDKNR